jgi:hypothetical protein
MLLDLALQASPFWLVSRFYGASLLRNDFAALIWVLGSRGDTSPHFRLEDGVLAIRRRRPHHWLLSLSDELSGK